MTLIEARICCLWWKDRSHWLPLPWTNWSMVESSAEFSQYLSRGQYLQYCHSNIFAGNQGQLCCKLWEFWRSGTLQITHLQLPESESLIFCVIVMLNIVLALQASRLHTSYCRGRIVAVFVLFNGKFPLPSPFSSDFYLHCHPLPSSPKLSSCCFYSNTFVDAHIGRRDYQCPWVDLFCHPNKYDEFTITITISPSLYHFKSKTNRLI